MCVVPEEIKTRSYRYYDARYGRLYIFIKTFRKQKRKKKEKRQIRKRFYLRSTPLSMKFLINCKEVVYRNHTTFLHRHLLERYELVLRMKKNFFFDVK